jgi:hypothetical protein
MLMEQIIAMQHPLTYVGAQQTYQKNNAEIQQLRAHAKFYAENPEMRQAIANAQIEGRQNVANTQVAGKLEVQGLTLEHKRELDAAKSEQINAIDTTLNKQLEEDQIGPLNADKKPIFTPEQYGSVVETQRALMYPQHAGGANMNKLAAKNASEQLGQRNWTIKEQLDSKGNRMVDASGNPLHYGMYDSEGHAHGYLSPAAVGRLMAIPGMGGVLQQQQAPAEGGAKPVHGALNMQPSPVGAGAGTYGAMSQGIGQNLAGIAPTPMQQRQSYPQSMVA